MEEQLEDISKKLSIIVAFTVKSRVDEMGTTDIIKLLDSHGLANGEIATLLEMKPNAVSMARSRMKGAKK